MTEEHAPTLSVEVARRRIEASWDAWLGTVRGIPEERLAEPGACGGWAIKDLIGHVAFWDADAIQDIGAYLGGMARPKEDVDALNARSAAAHAARGAEEVRAEMERTHAAVVALLTALAPDDPRALAACREIAVDTWEHYDEHAAQVRAWRQRVGL